MSHTLISGPTNTRKILPMNSDTNDTSFPQKNVMEDVVVGFKNH